ncbi:hypothetical protein NDU88_012883 [Pleurodeles waltl]|uniref:Uncharacterized protein n=1 Tax=Pleurodeles waltl TaxID=8319 RepID=A0AAV7R2S5_PLEWA|nr:hypothetical protein NDU88_012883 [Pleurodeles waltl]
MFEWPGSMASIFEQLVSTAGMFEQPGSMASIFEQPVSMAGMFERPVSMAGMFERPGSMASIFEQPVSMAGMFEHLAVPMAGRSIVLLCHRQAPSSAKGDDRLLCTVCVHG